MDRSTLVEMKDFNRDPWHVSVDRLIEIFRHGLLVLIPVFDEARIAWKGTSTYDDYERIAEAIYDSIVRDSIGSAQSLEGALPLARYGVRQPGRALSRILVGEPARRFSFHELDTEIEPFDTVICLAVGEDGCDVANGFTRLLFEGQQFTFEARHDGKRLPTRHRELVVNV